MTEIKTKLNSSDSGASRRRGENVDALRLVISVDVEPCSINDIASLTNEDLISLIKNNKINYAVRKCVRYVGNGFWYDYLDELPEDINHDCEDDEYEDYDYSYREDDYCEDDYGGVGAYEDFYDPLWDNDPFWDLESMFKEHSDEQRRQIDESDLELQQVLRDADEFPLIED